ncbi:MAG: alanine dehydrogenase [Bacteroidetes bacterium]|nr:alanine dehydrogenase [Bacteroidota bacterium]
MKQREHSSKNIPISILLPQEEMLEVATRKHNLYIGIPKETSFQENRVALVPDAVSVLVNNGHRVVIETNAGKMSNFQDNEYSEAGADIAHSPEEVYKADIILKVAPPSEKEIELIRPKQILLSTLQLSTQSDSYMRSLMNKRVTAIAYGWVQDKEGIYPVIRAMGEIAGSASILIAAEYLSNVNNGPGLILGGISGISPTEVVILGAGTVGEFAARAAIGLGATVKIFDNSLYKLRRIQTALGRRVFTSVIQPRVLQKHLKTADVVIGAIRATKGRTPCVVSEEMVKDMKDGSVIVDVSIDEGGCFETSQVTNHAQPIFRKHGVIHYCVPNIPSRVSRTASYAFSTVFGPLIMRIADFGSVDRMLKQDAGFRKGIYIYNGMLTNKYLGELFNIPAKDINLLLAAF